MDNDTSPVPPPVDAPIGEPLDVLGTASLTVERLRRFLADPVTPAEGPQRTELVDAWNLAPGDELPGGVLVLSVNREVRARTVRVLTDEPASADLPGDSPVPVVRRFF